MSDLKDYVISIPDFPKKGIIFRDITGITENPEAFHKAISQFLVKGSDYNFDSVAVLESRGFVFGSVIAYSFLKKLILVRKKGKLPRETVSKSYALEYGEAEIEITKTSVKPGDRVLIVDDLLATGGTVLAAADLIESQGGIVAGIFCVIDLPDCGGRMAVTDRGYNLLTLCSFEGD